MTEENTSKTEIAQPNTQSINVEESPPIKTEENQVNWKRFREEKERERKARVEAEREAERRKQEADALKAALEAMVNKPIQHEQPEETDEQRIQKQVSLALEKERQRWQEDQAKREAATVPQRLNSDFKDFNKVVNEENVDYLEYHHPEIASAFKYMPEGYDKWASLYKTVKKLVPNMDKKEDVKKIEQNLKKPQEHVPNISNQTPQTQGWKLTEQRRAENWRRMQEDMKGI